MNPLGKLVLPTAQQWFTARYIYIDIYIYIIVGVFSIPRHFSFINSVYFLARCSINQEFVMIMLRKLKESLICEWNQSNLEYNAL